jgi:hypothetical protein
LQLEKLKTNLRKLPIAMLSTTKCDHRDALILGANRIYTRWMLGQPFSMELLKKKCILNNLKDSRYIPETLIGDYPVG